MSRLSDAEAVELLQRLVQIPSVSGNEGEAAAFLVAAMQRLGFTAHVDEVGNAVGVRIADAGVRTADAGIEEGEAAVEVALLGHIDTVPGDIPVRLADGRLYGRGSVDAKGPLAAFVAAAARAPLRAGQRLVVVGAVEEEAATSKGARHIAAQLQPNLCIIGEPSGWDTVTLGYKGRLLLDYSATQPMRHTAGPGEGVAERAVAWWNRLAAYAEARNVGRERLFEQLTPSLRQMQTGSDGLVNAATMQVGLRLPPDCDAAALAAFAQREAAGATVRAYGYEPAFQGERRTPLVRAFNVALRAQGARPRYTLKSGTSDMNVVAPIWRCPIVAYGPGDSELDHTPQEHIVIEEYLRAIGVLVEVLEEV